MTTTPSEQDVAAAKAVMEEHCLGNDDRFPHGENVEESGCTCSRHTLDMLSAAIATARAEEREAACRAVCTYCDEHDPYSGAVKHPAVNPIPVYVEHRGWAHPLRNDYTGGSPLCAADKIRGLPTRRAAEESGRG